MRSRNVHLRARHSARARFPYRACSNGVSVLQGSTAAPAGFTLIEILVVIVVIGLLAALVAPNVFRHIDDAKTASARSQIEMFVAALDTYRLDNGRYPASSQGLEALRREPLSEPRPRAWRGPYLRREIPLDPWGNAFVYRSPGEANPWSFDLLSYGADGRAGGTGDDADIASWQ